MPDTYLISPAEAEAIKAIEEITRLEGATFQAIAQEILERERETLKCLSPDLGWNHG